MRLIAVLLAALAAVVSAAPVHADDGWRFRRTTPRAELSLATGTMALGIPDGRAWGIESALVRLPPRPGARVVIDIAVTDPAVREAFARVAYYGRAEGRSRQIGITDSELVAPGEARRVEIELDPPEGAVAYRLRVLARLVEGAEASATHAIRVGAPVLRGASPRPSLTRLAG